RIQQRFDLAGRQAFSYHLGYNYLRPSVQASEGVQSKYALESLRHQFIAGVNYSMDALSVQLENRLLKRELGKAYNVSDIRVNYQFEKVLLYTEVTNLFNTEYKEAGAVPMPLRWISLGVKYRWNP